jgi:dienelactone hydrolase
MRVLLILLLLPLPALAETIVVDQVDVYEGRRFERRELEIDAVESAIIAGRSLPDPIGAAEAGEGGWFEDDLLTGNYARAVVTVDEPGVWLLEGMAYAAAYVNGDLRIGNVYGWKEDWQDWEPNFNFSSVPVQLAAGENELLFFGIRWGLMRALLHRAESELVLNPRDATLPDLVVGESASMVGALPLINATGEALDDVEIEVISPDGARAMVPAPPIAPFGVRKVGFPIHAAPLAETGRVAFDLVVWRGGVEFDRTTLELEVKRPGENRRVTFVSEIDDSVQYFGFLPASGDPGPQALVLSLHGAAVEAINQSGSYAALDWAHIVAPTNRRPFGFDWENWGRLDALEVLGLATSNLEIEPDRIYLTGHSMGGHGTWHLSTLHPDRFAAAGPSAGWITYWSYRRDAPADEPDELKDMLARATLTSQTLEKAANLARLGIYVLHGGADDNVPPAQSHLMLERLEEFHEDFVYHEQPNVGHWWDLSEVPGADCVTWAPMFDFFARHRRPSIEEVRHVAFLTPNPAVSAWNRWAGVHRQQRVFEMSSIDLHLDPWRARVSGNTSNVEVLGLQLAHLGADSVWIDLDGESLGAAVPRGGPIWLEYSEGWRQIRDPDRGGLKGAHRNGGFRDAFTNRPQLVVGTQGSSDETARNWAKARFDAEYLWYQGNASLDLIADIDFDPDAEPDRNVVLYGNAENHEDWTALVDDEVDVRSGRVRIGDREFDGAALMAIRPRPGSRVASVGIIAGSDATAMRLTERRPILSGGFAYPDVTVLRDVGGRVVIGAGFFGNDWSVESGEFVWADD